MVLMKTDIFSQVKFDSNGLVPAIIQEAKTGEILMVAYMNKDSLEKTIEDGRTCFWSRSRKKFWIKGESSGNIQKVKKISIDCDGDALLIQVEQKGGAACHTGYKSCFYRRLNKNKEWQVQGKKVFDPKKVYK
ncbi:MAG: phosphoribosyl-AMP cyclohydrolase [Elusimicrobiota bacterium]